MWNRILCLWFRASLVYINNRPTRCNTKQSIYYSVSSLYMFRVSKTLIIRSSQNCNYSLRYWSLQCRQASLSTLEGQIPEAVVTGLWTPDDDCVWHPKHVQWTCRIINRLLCVASRWTVINIYMWNRSCWKCIKFQGLYKKTLWDRMRKCVYSEKYCPNEIRSIRICHVKSTGKCPGIYPQKNLVRKYKSGFFLCSPDQHPGALTFFWSLGSNINIFCS